MKVVFLIFFVFYWIYLFNVGIGFMNFFLFVFFDGGRMLDDVFKEYFLEKIVRLVRYMIIGVGLFFFVLNLWLVLLNFVG